MAIGPKHRVPPRRKREGKTDYRKGVKLLLSGKPRLVVRKTLRNTIIQLIEYLPEGDRTIAAANSKELSKYGWKGSTSNTAAAYLTGVLIGVRAAKKKHTEGLLDIGFTTPLKGCKVFGALKGALEAGMSIPACAIALRSPIVFSVTVLPPVFGPVITSIEKSPPISTEKGTAFSPSSGCLASTSLKK